MSPRKRVPVVCAILRDAHGCVLACRRPEGKALGGLWEFPGGKVELGESPDFALRRELVEELGVEVDLDADWGSVCHSYAEFDIALHGFSARIRSGAVVLREHSECRWIQPLELRTLQWAPADLPFVDRLVAEAQSSK